MRTAPAVRVTVTAPAAARAAVALLAGVAATSGLAWIVAHAGAHAAWGGLATAPGLWLGWSLGPRGGFDLAWDGQRWFCDGKAGRVAVQLDLRQALLLLWLPDDGRPTRWLLPGRAGCGAQWHALRVALFASRHEAALGPAGQPPLSP